MVQYCAKEVQTKFGVFRSLFSRKFDEISPRNFVKELANFRRVKRNFESTEAKFRFAEISSEQKFATAKFRNSENSQVRNFHKATFYWQWRRIVMKTFCWERFEPLARVIYLV